MKRTIFWGIVAACGTASVYANAANEWIQTGPEGGRAHWISGHPLDADTLFVGSHSALYRSTDGGDSWKLLSEQIPNSPACMSINPANPDYIYAVTTNQMVFSIHSSGTTVELTSGIDNLDALTCLAIAADGSKMYVAGSGTMYVSTNFETFTTKNAGWPSDDTARAMVVDPANANTVYAAGSKGLYKTVNGGDTWSAIAVGQPAPGLYTDLVIDTAAPGTLYAILSGEVYRTTDAGTTWSTANTGIPDSVRNIARDAASGRLYAGTHTGGIYFSDNGGTSWTFAKKVTRTHNTELFVAADGDFVIAGGNEGVYRSLDDGTTWSFSSDGIHRLAVTDVAKSDERLIVAADRVGYFSSVDGSSFVYQDDLPVSAQFDRMSFHSADPQIGYAVSFGTVHRTNDGGASWTAVAGNGLASARVVAADRVNPDVAYAAEYDTVKKTIDGGATWSTLGTGLTGVINFHVIAQDPSDPDRLLVGTLGSGIYLSEDAGETWEEVLPDMGGQWVLDIEFDPHDSKNVVVASVNAGLWRSRDSGVTWEKIGDDVWNGSNQSVQSFQAIAFDPERAGIVYAGAMGDGVFRSVDGGDNWAAMNQGLTPHSIFDADIVESLQVDPRNTSRIYAGTWRGLKSYDLQVSVAAQLFAPASAPAPGASFEVDLSIENDGPHDATGVSVETLIPEGIALDGATGKCTTTENVVSCETATLKAGATWTITLALSSDAAGSYEIASTVISAEPDSDTSDNGASTVVTVAAPGTGGGGGGGGGGAMFLLCLLLGPLEIRRLVTSR